jgi:tetratricopeptide (TPR) repeat protein
MANLVSKKLLLVKELINKGKYEEAFNRVEDIEQKNNLFPETKLRTQYYKGLIYFFLGKNKITLKISEELYQTSQEMKKPIFTLYALFIKEYVLYGQQRLEEYFKTLEKHETLFKSIPREDSFEFQETEACFFGLKGASEIFKGNFDLAFEYHKKGLRLLEELDPNHFFIPGILMGIAYDYQNKGELDLALEYDLKALSLFPKEEFLYIISNKAQTYRNMGLIYYQKGDLDRALEYHLECLELYKTAETSLWINSSYLSIIEVMLAKKNFVQAKIYLQQFKEFNDKHKTLFSYLRYEFAHALILKSSTRLRDRVEAEKILKKIVVDNMEDLSIFLIPNALINLCDLYIEEFRLTNQIEILDDIYPLIDKLQRHASYSNSYYLLANVKLLQAKLALFQINMVSARKLLIEAQKIADEHGLRLLAGEISKEHDHLLEELKLWESFKKTQASVAERLKLASVDEVMERLQGRGAIDLPEMVNEEPILLLIMDNSGATYFNYPFAENWDYTDLFSSFMSAFNTFIDEIFSNSIDRIKVKENTILINPIESFLTCYVIKGQSYPALQKLKRFTEAIKENPEIWQALNKSVKTSEMLELDKPPVLKTVIDEIFN